MRISSGSSLLAALGILLVVGSPFGMLGGGARRHPNGILVVEEPKQSSLSPAEHWTRGEYRVTAVASYSLRARLVQSRSYWFGREADLSPTDFLLAWGVASDQQVQDAISTSLSGRYYRWWPKERALPTDSGSISESMANTHVIPASEAVRRDLDRVAPGDVIELSGYLVNVTAKDGWRWTTSLTRTDAGAGACELMWVESVRISASR